MNPIRQRGLLILAVSALALAACGKHKAPAQSPAPPAKPAAAATQAPPAAPAPMISVMSVQVGNAVDDKGMVTSSGLTFAPKDTIYAVVSTNSPGQANATINAKWTYGDDHSLVNSSDQKVSSNGMATTTFHISKPDGFPAGNYTLQVSVDGKVQSTTNFEVK